MFCPKCGTNVPEGSKFCESCGYNIQQAEQAIRQEPQQASPQPTYNPGQTQYQPQYQAQNYQPRPQPAPAYQNNTVNINITDPREKVYGIGGWLGTLLLSSIPLVGFICLLVWAFSSNTNKNKKNFAIAMLIFMVILLVISVILYASIMAAIGSFFDQLGDFDGIMW